MAIKSNALAENKAAMIAEDGGTIYATLQMRHGKESEMDTSKFVPAEIGVVTDTKRAVVAFAPGDTKDVAFKEDIPEQDKNYNNLENKPSIDGTELSGNKTLKELGIQPKGDYLTQIPEEYVTDTELAEKLNSYPTKEEQTAELGKKLDKDQGKENTGKALVVGEDGTVKPGETPIKVDDTLSQTGQAADAEKVGARLHEIDSTKFQGPVKTISGEILKIENAAEQPPAGLRVYGKAKQNTTTGAQLLNAPDKTNKIYGVTMDVSGGVASFSGTLSSNNATFWFIGSYNGTDVVMTLPAGKYYIQNCSMQTLGNSALKTGAITSETEIQITGVAYTYTKSSPKTIYPMINAGTTALPWEPYTGGQPSPNPDYTQEIELSGDSGKINLLIADGQEEQTLIISTPNGLLGLPVDSGGNYTDSNGQQWVCDEIDFVRGKYIQRIGKTNFVETSWIRNNSGQYYTNKDFDKYKIDSLVICSHMLGKDTGASENTMFVNNNGNIRLNYKNTTDTIEYIADIMNDAVMYGILAEPIETDLSPEEIAAYRTLRLNNPVTNIFANDSLMPGIEVDYVPETEQYIEKSITKNTQKAPAIVEKASGEILNVMDSSDLGLKGLKVFGKSEQVKTTGAQLISLPYDGSDSQTGKGITFKVNSDGSITVNGTATSGVSFRLKSKPEINLSSKLWISGGRDGVLVQYSNNKDKGFSSSNGPVEITEKFDESNYTGTALQLYVKQGTTINNVTIYPMLNAGESPLPWEPYTGGKPSPSPEYPQEIEIPGDNREIGVEVTGAQLSNVNLASVSPGLGLNFKIEDGRYYVVNGVATNTSVKNVPINGIEHGKTYTLSGCPKGGSNDKYSLEIRDTTGTGIPGISAVDHGNGATFTIPESVELKNVGITVRIASGYNANNLKFEPMLNTGSKALPWEPYKQSQILTLSTPNGLPGIPVDSDGNYTDESGQQWVCDEIDLERGVYVHRIHEIVIDGEENFFEEAASYWNLSPYGIPIAKTTSDQVPITISNTFQDVLYNPDSKFLYLISSEYDSYINVGALNERLKELYEKKSPAKILYVLEQPVETDLTMEEITAYHALHTNYPTTKVSTDSIPQAGLEMEYVADTKSYIDKKFEELQKALVNTNTQVLNKTTEDIKHV